MTARTAAGWGAVSTADSAADVTRRRRRLGVVAVVLGAVALPAAAAPPVGLALAAAALVLAIIAAVRRAHPGLWGTAVGLGLLAVAASVAAHAALSAILWQYEDQPAGVPTPIGGFGSVVETGDWEVSVLSAGSAESAVTDGSPDLGVGQAVVAVELEVTNLAADTRHIEVAAQRLHASDASSYAATGVESSKGLLTSRTVGLRPDLTTGVVLHFDVPEGTEPRVVDVVLEDDTAVAFALQD